MAHGTDWDQIDSGQRQGDGAKGQTFGGGTTTTGDIAIYDAGGNVIDGGVSLATIVSEISTLTTEISTITTEITTITSEVGPWVEEIPTGTLDSSNVTFTLSFTPILGSLTLFLNIQQREGTDFTITGSTITFTVAPKHRDTGWFQARYQH